MSFFNELFCSMRCSRFAAALPGKLSPSVERQVWTGEMVLEGCGSGQRIKHPGYSCASERLRWVSWARDAGGAPLKTRCPTEHTEAFPAGGSFTAAGKRYSGLRQLFVRTDESCTWCRDKYGREVLYLVERFPCFDSFDAMDESRCYRWFFLREGERLTRVYYMDGGMDIHVTEDVENLEHKCWEQMLELDYFDTKQKETGI